MSEPLVGPSLVEALSQLALSHLDVALSVVLFGSHATNTADERSDLDVLVVWSDTCVLSEDERYELLAGFESEVAALTGWSVEALTASQADLVAALSNPAGLYASAAVSGCTLSGTPLVELTSEPVTFSEELDRRARVLWNLDRALEWERSLGVLGRGSLTEPFLLGELSFWASSSILAACGAPRLRERRVVEALGSLTALAAAGALDPQVAVAFLNSMKLRERELTGEATSATALAQARLDASFLLETASALAQPLLAERARAEPATDSAANSAPASSAPASSAPARSTRSD